MHGFLLEKVIAPTLLAICDLCEKHGISFVCYVEHKDVIISDIVTNSVQADASERAHTLKAISEGKNVNSA